MKEISAMKESYLRKQNSATKEDSLAARQPIQFDIEYFTILIFLQPKDIQIEVVRKENRAKNQSNSTASKRGARLRSKFKIEYERVVENCLCTYIFNNREKILYKSEYCLEELSTELRLVFNTIEELFDYIAQEHESDIIKITKFGNIVIDYPGLLEEDQIKLCNKVDPDFDHIQFKEKCREAFMNYEAFKSMDREMKTNVDHEEEEDVEDNAEEDVEDNAEDEDKQEDEDEDDVVDEDKEQEHQVEEDEHILIISSNHPEPSHQQKSNLQQNREPSQDNSKNQEYLGAESEDIESEQEPQDIGSEQDEQSQCEDKVLLEHEHEDKVLLEHEHEDKVLLEHIEANSHVPSIHYQQSNEELKYEINQNQEEDHYGPIPQAIENSHGIKEKLEKLDSLISAFDDIKLCKNEIITIKEQIEEIYGRIGVMNTSISKQESSLSSTERMQREILELCQAIRTNVIPNHSEVIPSQPDVIPNNSAKSSNKEESEEYLREKQSSSAVVGIGREENASDSEEMQLFDRQGWPGSLQMYRQEHINILKRKHSLKSEKELEKLCISNWRRLSAHQRDQYQRKFTKKLTDFFLRGKSNEEDSCDRHQKGPEKKNNKNNRNTQEKEPKRSKKEVKAQKIQSKKERKVRPY